jgi:hypothetical protein
MDDQFMLGAWRRPRTDFARQLRDRLDQQDLERAVIHRPRPMLRAAAYAATVLLAVAAFALPQVRAGAAAFLDLFRVVNFAPVAFQPERMKDLSSLSQLDLPHLLGDQVQILKKATPPQDVADAQAASTASGMRVRMPAWLPPGMAPERFEVSGDHAVRFTLNTVKLNGILDVVGIDSDLRVPPEADGQAVTLNMPPVVHVTFKGQEERTVSLFQARQPEASFPPSADLPTLAEIGLRILGVERAEAHRFAQNVDWRSTLLVPVPANVATFKQVDVNGSGGLLIEMKRPTKVAGGPGNRPPPAQLMWSSGGSVYVLTGTVRPEELFTMAQSMQ